MFLRVKKQIIGLIDTVDEMVHIFDKIERQTAVNDCKMAMHSIQGTLNNEEPLPQQSIDQINLILRAFDEITVTNTADDVSGKIKYLQKNIKAFRQSIQKEIVPKLNVAFFPYKATMWNSLATVYEAAALDENCVAKVIPVPFYEIGGPQPVPCYEGDQFPDNVPITPYDQYDLEVEQPDIIFVHNIYDQYNTITQIEPTYFASNLKKYTDMLVYIPYCISGYRKYEPHEFCATYPGPTVQFVDKIIVANKLLKDCGVQKGISENKILVLGSPKVDFLARQLKQEKAYPDKWKNKLIGKTVYLLNTGCMYFVNAGYDHMMYLITLCAMAQYNEDIALIWRPHPLTLTSIKKYTPELLPMFDVVKLYMNSESDIYDSWNKNLVYDDSVDYLPAIQSADACISDPGSSFVNEFFFTGKPLVLLQDGPTKELAEFGEGSFNYAFPSEGETIFSLYKKIGKCNKADDGRRINMIKKIFTDIHGLCGNNVYFTIKKIVLDDFNR